ncbi:hypothetical protein EGW08_016938, partial [Elysia chlorotica]
MKGTRTGVYIGVSNNEVDTAYMKNWTDDDAYMVQGCHHSMYPNWISFFFDFSGPSTAYNTACSTSLVCLDAAERHLRMGVIDNAIVGGSNFIYRPATTKLFMGMNFLGSSTCKAFDESGDGFVRGEVASAILLKKADTAKRVYCTLVGSMLNNDGNQTNDLVTEKLTREYFPPWYPQVKYFECHGTGTQAGDPNETRAICNAVCKGKKDPLLIGSIKSNLGHGETASGINGISKVIITMHSRQIPPNLHFKNPNPKIPGLFDGRLKVVTETTPFDGGLIAINSFGMGGTNAHAIFRSFDKRAEPHPASDKPRLFTYCARTEEGLQRIFEEAHKHASNVEFHALCQESANTKPKSLPYRGATILNAEGEYTEIQKCPSKAREVWFVYSGMGSQWVGMGRSLMALDVFRQSIEETAAILSPFGVDLMSLLMDGTEDKLKEIMPPFICINAIQLALTDLLTSMGIVPDGLVGHSLGEVGCAYADGCLTRREAILSAFWRAKAVIDCEVKPGKMAAVELTWEEAKRLCPPGVVAACHNSQDSVTISGGAQEMTKFMAELSAQGVTVKEVNSNNISYHSSFMTEPAAYLKKGLEKEIVPKPRSKKWISTSIPEERWGNPNPPPPPKPTTYTQTPIYNLNLFAIPSNAIAIEIAPAGLLQSVIKKSLGQDCTIVALQKRKSPNNLEVFFSALGKCYSHGVPMNPLGLYPAVQFPVSIDTPMLSSMVSEAWDHSAKWRVPLVEEFEYGSGSSSDNVIDIDLSEDSPENYLLEHAVDGRMLFPATGTLVLAWKTLAKLKGVEFEQLAVQMTNVQIHQALFLNPGGTVKMTVTIFFLQNHPRNTPHYFRVHDIPTSFLHQPDKELLFTKEIYREFLLRGYEYGAAFQGIQRASLDATDTDIRWDGRWISYLDTVLQMYLLSKPGTHQALPTLLESVTIDPRVHPAQPPEGTTEFQVLPGKWDPVLQIAAAGGVEIRSCHSIRASRRLNHDPPILEDFAFAPYVDPRPSDRSAAATVYISFLTNSHGLFEMLDIAFSEPLEGDYWDRLRMKLHDVRTYLWDDPIIAALESPDIVKLVMETVSDNVNQQVMEILEVGAARGPYYRQAIPKALEYFSIKDWQYTVADQGFVEDAAEFPVKMMQFDPLDPANFPAELTESCDLLVLKWNLQMQVDLDAAITAFSKMIKPGGFLLVLENGTRLSTFFPIKAIVSASLGGKGGPEGDRAMGCFYTDAQWSALFARHGFEQIMHIPDGIAVSMFLLRKPFEPSVAPIIINVDDLECSWLEEVQARCAELQDSHKDSRLWLVANTELSGVLGFLRSLVWEFGSEKLRCIQIDDATAGPNPPKISADSADFKELVRKDLAYNVFKNGKWGTYRGFVISDADRQKERPSEYVYADWLSVGDMSSLRWFDSPLKTGHNNGMLGSKMAHKLETETCSVYYAGLNLRDIILANGTIQRDILPEETFFKEGVLGVEFSGRNSSGKRVMGLCPPPALASTVKCPVSSLWSVPDQWTLEEAATVPLAYATAYYCLVSEGGVQKGATVFIHAGASVVGQASIAVALSYNCEIFTLTKNSDETALLKSMYPQLNDRNFCSSEDCSFEKYIRKETKGSGVDVVINTLRGKFLKASRRLLSKKGKFVDIGFKVDSNTQIAYYTREHPDLRFQLDALLESQGPEWTRLFDLVQAGIHSGVVKPLKRAVYSMDKIVDAFKTVEAEREAGKIVIKIRDEERQKVCPTPRTSFPAIHRTCFHPDKSHILVGGMGGMGLETAHWMVLRGAKKLILTSRYGITTGYQARKIAFFKQLGVEVEVLALSVNTRKAADKVFEHALKMGPVGGIFNMAMVLYNDDFLKMNREQFLKPLESKITMTMLLDDKSREKPVRDTLDHFVMFSSLIVSGGHLGQANYAFGSTVLEKICERRKRDGLPGECLMWASIADVGTVALMGTGNETIICRKYPQRFFNVLSVFDFMMSSDNVVTISYVLVEKSMGVAAGEESMVDQVLRAVGKVLG